MSEFVSARKFILDFLYKELVGPAPNYPDIQPDGQEILRAQDPPRLRYSAGVLFPMKSEITTHNESGDNEKGADNKSSQEDELSVDTSNLQETLSTSYGETDSSAENDQEVTLANEFLPSAMGISALLEVSDYLIVDIEAGTYRQSEMELSKDADQSESKFDQKGWWRQQLNFTVELPPSELLGDQTKVIEKPVHFENGQPVLELHLVSRPHFDASGSDLTRLITFTLINRKRSEKKTPDNSDCFFQCGFKVTTRNRKKCFKNYPERAFPKNSEEELSLQLLHLHRRTFAIGHGCAAEWEESEGDYTSMIRTEVMPVYEMKPVLPKRIPGLELEIKDLAFDETNMSIDVCTRLCKEYENWISEKENELSQMTYITCELKKTAERHLDQCRECLRRMRDGIEVLKNDDKVARAFRLMNEAMLMQYIHYEISSQKVRNWVSRSGKLELEDSFKQPCYSQLERKWHPFQLAFILQNILPIADPNCTERKVVDIIWFPTGGGKTEAYLGLSAFSMLLRRIRNPNNAGTCTLMRYTLRLLTTQQFQRAASLICACEVIRRREPLDLGTEKFSIGLWVGGDVTPNSEKAGVQNFNKLYEQSGDNKFILLSCPWCGAAMGPQKFNNTIKCKGYKKLAHPNRIRHICEDEDCEFSSGDGLPLAVIDDHIYDSPPTLLLGTVDKFAMLAFKPASRSLFGLGFSYSPPELIIQDELHLISGPLGSMVGHYETVIDALCMNYINELPIPAKIIASTATISRAERQAKDLYGRPAFLFPPQALKIGDTFFAEESKDKDVRGRLYVGVFASALPSHVTAQVRTMGALLQGAKLIPTEDPDVINPYWTMVGYFNSLRELGQAATLVNADIREYLNALWIRIGLRKDKSTQENIDLRRFLNSSVELTSRIQSSEIPEVLQRLFSNYDGSNYSDAVDICFATNMIQVGLDVPRLSLMTIVGQPKTTSEYIQASSRIGRDIYRPGIVITNYNTYKPRDRSHYEHFRSYHQGIYRHVEPTSVTPFAAPVRERALHALVVILCRFWGNSELRNSPNFPPEGELVQRIKDCIKERVMAVDPTEWPGTNEVIDKIVNRWSIICPFEYGSFFPSEEALPLMYPAGGQRHENWGNMPFATPTSMRNVDATCEAIQLRQGYGSSKIEQ